MQGGFFGRSERIRTSDPLLPKQVRYQAALRSDRGWGLLGGGGVCKGGRGEIFILRAIRCHPSFGSRDRPRRNSSEMRGRVPVSGREREFSTGRFSETVALPSRSTM